MNILITGSSNGMGVEIALRFLDLNNHVIGLDIDKPNPILERFDKYTHYICDVANKDELPDIANVNVLINNAGVQNSGRDMDVNVKGVINCTEKYGLQSDIQSILNQASVSAHNGAEFPEYVASKGAVLSYTRWCAREIAKYGATCNSLSFGGVSTELNQPVIADPDMWSKIMDLTPLRKWVTPKEAADWVYFFTVVNRSATGQDIIIDNGETLNSQFIWPNI